MRLLNKFGNCWKSNTMVSCNFASHSVVMWLCTRAESTSHCLIDQEQYKGNTLLQ